MIYTYSNVLYCVKPMIISNKTDIVSNITISPHANININDEWRGLLLYRWFAVYINQSLVKVKQKAALKEHDNKQRDSENKRINIQIKPIIRYLEILIKWKQSITAGIAHHNTDRPQKHRVFIFICCFIMMFDMKYDSGTHRTAVSADSRHQHDNKSW